MDACKSCGEKSLERDYHYGEEEYVCTSCGVVQEIGSFCTSQAAETSSYVTNNNTLFKNQAAPLAIQTQTYSTKSKGWKCGNQVIAQLASTFRLSSLMKQEASALFEKAVTHNEFHMSKLESKRGLAASCVYVVMRQHNWPVTVSNMCSAMGRCRGDFSKPYKKLLVLFNISISTPPIEELVEGFVNECKGLDSSEKERVMPQVYKILQLAKECWLTDGRTPRQTLIASIYLAWQSLEPSRCKTSFYAFCRKMGFTCTVNLKSRNAELVKIVCTMGSAIPWFDANHITPKNVAYHLEDILKYSNALMEDVGIDAKRVLQSKIKEQQPVCTNLREDFSDEEIDSYIRTKEEVQFIKEVMKAYPD